MVQTILEQFKCPKRRQSGRVMSLVRVHRRVAVSVGGVLGLRYAKIKTVGSELFRSSRAMRLTNRRERVGRGVIISCGQKLDFT